MCPGQVAEVASGGYLLATPHRVLSTSAARLSVPFFYNPALECRVEPLPLPVLPWERNVAYDTEASAGGSNLASLPLGHITGETLTWLSAALVRSYATHSQSHWRRPKNAMLHEYGANAFKSLARSHPAVFERHHPDLRVTDDGRVVKRAEDVIGKHVKENV